MPQWPNTHTPDDRYQIWIDKTVCLGVCVSRSYSNTISVEELGREKNEIAEVGNSVCCPYMVFNWVGVCVWVCVLAALRVYAIIDVYACAHWTIYINERVVVHMESERDVWFTIGTCLTCDLKKRVLHLNELAYFEKQ